MSDPPGLLALQSALELERLTEVGFWVAPLNGLLAGLPGELEVCDLVSVEDGDERCTSMQLAVKRTLWFTLPGLGALALGIVRTGEDEWPLIYAEVRTGGAAPSLEIAHFPLTVALANPLLKPVGADGQAAPGLQFEIEGGFRIGGDGAVAATVDAFGMPPFEIVGTGLELALQGCRLILRDEDVDAAIVALGFTTGLRGLHAASARLDWALPLQLVGQALPGIHASFEGVVIGNQGVSFDATLQWPVAIDGSQFDPDATELLGWFVDPDWRFALAGLRAKVQANVPTALAASGHLRVPLLDAMLDAEVYADYAGEGRYALRGSLRTHDGGAAQIALGAPGHRLALTGLQLDGELAGQVGGGASPVTQLRFSGRSGVELELPGLEVTAASVTIELEHSEAGETFELVLQDIDVDAVGQIHHARLFVGLKRAPGGARTLDRLELRAALRWAELASRTALAQLPPDFPLPPDDAEVALVLHWADGTLKLGVEATLAEVDQLWRFVPAAQRPEVASALITGSLVATGDGFDGELGLKLRLRLPDLAALPGFAAPGLAPPVQVTGGDDQGWIDAEFKAELASADGQPTGALAATLASPVGLAFQLPGLVLPRPPLEVSVSSLVIELSSDAGQTEGEFRLAGGFVLRPILPADLGGLVPGPMAVHLERLFAVAHRVELAGSASLRLGQAAAGGYLALDCRFSGADLQLDLFDMLAGAAAQMTGGAVGGHEIELDVEVSFALKSIALSIGHVPGASGASASAGGLPMRLAIACEFGFAGQFAELGFELGAESLSFGIERLAVPVALPPLPLSRRDLDALRDAAGRWDLAIWTGQVQPAIDARLAVAQAALADARAALDALPAGTDEQQRFELRYRVIPRLQKAIFDGTGKKFLTQAVLAVYRMLGQLSTAESRAAYQQWVELYQDAVDFTLGSLHFDTGLLFVIRDARFVLPFNDPSAIRVEGGATLEGFAPDDPLAPLQDLVFKLGLSADAIYFAVEGGADPIPLPSFGRYQGNAVELDRLIIGYGYSKNSLKVDFAGALHLSPALVADADTSRRIGAGVRLPTTSRLQFNVDLIPIVLGEVDFLLPLVAFDVDLRSEHPLPPPAGEPCAPAWDGLQLHVPGVLRAGFERARFSPFFGPLPSANYLWAFDIALGNHELGLTQVCDRFEVITPVGGMLPIPLLTDNTPFFDRLCTSVRLAGFGIHVDLRRPFPHPSPLMFFELLGFLSDPTLPIDPAGHLADLMWAELRHAQISLPPAVLGMFPEHGRLITRPLDMRINVGSVISFGQSLMALLQRLEAELADAGQDIGAVVQRLAEDPPQPDVESLLDALPPALRRVELRGSFVGFDASAVFLLVAPQALRDGVAAAGAPALAPAPPAAPGGHGWAVVVDERFAGSSLEGWRAVHHGLKGGQGLWVLRGGALYQDRNVGDNSVARYGAMLIRATEPLAALRVTVDMHSVDDDGMGVVFHADGDTSFYRFRMTSEQRVWHLMRLKRGVTRTLHETPTAFVPRRVYQVCIEAVSAAHDRPATHIRVWVDGAQWCDLVDADDPLTEGQAGLDSWWNLGTRFDRFVVERAEAAPARAYGARELAASARLAPLPQRPHFAGVVGAPVPPAIPVATWAADDLAGFDAADLHAALQGDALAVAVAARVRVLGQQTYRFLGVMRADGGFRLLTTAGVEPLRLVVAGLEVELAAQMQGRLLLEGQSAGADSWARVEASLWVDWAVLPAPGGALARLRIASAQQPASLALDSRGAFRIGGDGALHLFGDAVVVEGSVDASDRHLFVAGALSFAPDLFAGGSQRVLELTLQARGRVGPGAHFALAGQGSMELLGRSVAAVAGELTPDGIGLEARLDSRLDAGSQPWTVAGFALHDLQLALRGQVGFGGALPALAFEGSGRLTIGAARVEGQCRIAADGSGWSLAASGRLHWQGREWLAGAVELGSAGLTVQGQTSFVLQLTPQQLPAGVEVAGLILSATVGGSLTVGSDGRLRGCRFHLEWTLALRLPGAGTTPLLPVASQRLLVERSALADQDAHKLADLFSIDGLSLLPLGGMTIPVPTISTTGGTPVYLHAGVKVDPPPVDLPVPVVVATVGNDAPPAGSSFMFGFAGFNLWSHTPSVDVPAVTLPVPLLSNDPPAANPNQAPLFTLPQVGLGEFALSGTPKLAVAFSLELAWQNGTLGLKVMPGGQFHAFDSLPALALIPGQLMTAMTRHLQP